MSDFLSDQDRLDLIGDLASYMGLPGFIPGTSIVASSGQHPLQPLLAELSSNTSLGTFIVLAPSGVPQRCILPNAVDGLPNPCTAIAQNVLEVPGLNSDPVLARYDLIVGQAVLNASPASGQAALGATFQYVKGTVGHGPPLSSVPPNFAPVVQITAPPASGAILGSDVQVILPSLTTLSVSGIAVPQIAVVVTAPPFSAPSIVSGAQGLIAPAVDAMGAIQAALNAAGPGGAISIPSGTYGVASTAQTVNGSVAGPLGSSGTPNGQTIIFGGEVSFVALADVPAFSLGAGTVTIGTPTFYDNVLTTAAVSGVTIDGLTSYTIPLSGAANPNWANSAYALVSDTLGNQLFGLITASASGAANLIQIDTAGEQIGITAGTIAVPTPWVGFSAALDITVGPSLVEGQSIYIEDSSGHWISAIVTPPLSGSTYSLLPVALSPVLSTPISSGAAVMLTHVIPSSTANSALGALGSAGPPTVKISTTGNSFAVQLAGKGINAEGFYTNGWANGVLLGEPLPYGTTALTDMYARNAAFSAGSVGSITCDAVSGTGVRACGNSGGSVHDSHITSIYCAAGGAGVCGFDAFGPGGGDLNSLKISHFEALGFLGAIGPTPMNEPPSQTTICAVGICIRGPKPQAIQFGQAFTSSVGIGVYLDAGVFDIFFSLLNAGGDGYGSTYTEPVSGIPSPLSGYNVLGNGASGSKIGDIYIGQGRFPGASSNNSLYGIYLLRTEQFHCDFAYITNKNQDGVRIADHCQSIGFDHLILDGNGLEAGYGINDTGDSSSQYISIDKLDVSMETADAGPINLDAAQHVSYNDMGTVPSSGVSFGYYTSDGSSDQTPGMTIGRVGANIAALQLFNSSSVSGAVGVSRIGTATWALNSVDATVVGISNALSSGDAHALALDDSGNLGLAGKLFLNGGPSISAGSSLPGGSAVKGSIYIDTSGSSGHILYVYNGTSWVNFA
jgi:hypothetical protein